VRLTLAEIRKRVENEGDAYRVLEEMRWPDGPVCPHCDNKKAYFLNPANGKSRMTNKGSFSQRRVWKCAACRKQFSVLTGTIFHGTKVPIEVWLMIMVQMCSAKNGISAREIERMHKLTPETAWFVLHRLREAMKREPLAGALRGTIQADEAWIGGDPTRMNAKTRARWEGRDETPVPVQPHAGRPNQHTDKTPILSLIDSETGEVRSQVVTDVSGPTLRKAIAEQVDMPGSHLQTDEQFGYRQLGQEFRSHRTVNHSQGEYVSRATGATINRAENYFSQLKRSIDGTHHHVSKEHLPRYLAEFDFRYSTCKMNDADRLQMMVDRSAGRRLAYRPLTGER
jgi:transposase-like protein